MKKLFYIIMVCFIATLTATAQEAATHHLKVRVEPSVSLHFSLKCYEPSAQMHKSGYFYGASELLYLRSDTLDVVDVELPVDAGITIWISAYGSANGSFEPIDWRDAGTVVDVYRYNNGNSYHWRMPDHDVDLVGTFEYVPYSPSEGENPGMGSWDPETGTLILEGSSEYWPIGYNRDTDKDKVQRFVRISNAFGNRTASFTHTNYPNCTVIDYSHTNAATVTCMDSREDITTSVVEAILPATVTYFDTDAFKNTHLQTLVLYSLTPPELKGRKWNSEIREYEWATSFPDCPDMVVRVPAEAVPLYLADEHWKEYTIVPMESNYSNLTVQLMATPVAVTLAQYKGMSLLLTDKKSGQARRYLLNVQNNSYEFRYLPVNSTFKVQLLNGYGTEVAVLDNVFVGEENKTVTFDHLRRPHQMVLNLSDGTSFVDLSLYEVTWLNGEGNYISKGYVLNDALDGEQLRYAIHLDRSLAMQYTIPDSTLITVGAEGQPDNIVVPLLPIAKTNATFTVVDAQTHLGINGATIIVTQRLDYGEAGSVTTLTTGIDGKAIGEVLATMSHVSVKSPLHGTQELIINMADSTNFRMAFVTAEGTTIRLQHTYQEAVAADATPAVVQGYDKGQSLNYEFKAILPDGSEMALTDYMANYPVYTLYDQLPQDTKVRVKATGVNDEIEPVEAEAVVGSNGIVAVTLPIVQRGYLSVRYVKSDSRRPSVLLFNDATGELVKKVGFGNYMTAEFRNLTAGNYLVAVMSNGPAFQLINSRSQLLQYEADKDYVSQQVTLADGRLTEAVFDKVPLTMTQLETNLTTRRALWKGAAAYAGFQTGIEIKVQFKGLTERIYRRDWYTYYDHSKYPTDCRVEVYLPEGMSRPLAQRSLRMYSSTGYTWPIGNGVYMQGGDIETLLATDPSLFFIDHSTIQWTTAKSVWNERERKLTVEWPHIDEDGKMYIVTGAGNAGTYTPEVYLTYTLNGKQYREVLETNTLTVETCDIKAPEVVTQPRFRVSGHAQYTGEKEMVKDQLLSDRWAFGGWIENWSYKEIPYEAITIMDGNQPIGKAAVNSSGTWEAWVTLPKTTTLSKHNIYATVKPYKGQDYTFNTEVKEVTYDPDAVVPLATKMTFFNHHPAHLESIDVTFDYMEGKCTPRSYGFSNEQGYDTDFTFEVNLSNNDTTKVYACALFVATNGPDATEDVLWAHYNKRKNRWIAYAKYNTRSLPYSVMVEPYYHKENIGSAEDVNEGYNLFDTLLNNDNQATAELLTRFSQLVDQDYQAALSGDPSKAIDPDELNSVMQQLYALTGGGEYAEGSTTTDGDIDALLKSIDDYDSPMKRISDIYADVQKKLNEVGELVEGITTSPATGLTPEGLLADGYEELKLDDGTSVYVRTTEDGGWTYVDFAKNVKMDISADAKLARMLKGPQHMSTGEEWFYTAVEMVYLTAQDFVDVVGKVADACSAVVDACSLHIDWCVSKQKDFIAMVEFNNKNLSWVERGFANLRLKFAYDSMTKSITAAQKLKDAVSKFKFGDGVGTLASFYSLAKNYMGFKDQDEKLYKLAMSLPIKDCYDWQKAVELQGKIMNFIMWIIPYQTATLFADFAAVSTGLASLMGITVDPSGATWLGVALSFAKIAISYAADKIYQDRYECALEVFNYEKADIICDKKKTCQQRGDCPTCVSTGTCPQWPKLPKEPKYPTTDPLIDPSGFVYEGVESNRLEGVTTTVFYKEVTKDIFGNDVENVSLWDAENYDQQNPQLTNENGEYGWMVPSGLWQVKYEKQGYQTEFSEWLPVPPPQLDVNQGMTTMASPVVSDVKATPNAVQITFDKYMRADSLTTNRIFVTRNGQKVNGTIDPLLPADEAENMVHLTNRVNFVPAAQLPAGQKLTLTVKGDVVSYAGVEMGSDFQQEFDIKAAVERIVVEAPSSSLQGEERPAVNVVLDKGYALNLYAEPAAAAAGKKVVVRLLGDMVASIVGASASGAELTLDAQGKGSFIITGEAQGTTALLLQMADDPQVKQTVVITVREEGEFVCPMPTSNYRSSQAYPEGTQIALTCDLPGATIWYTLDGSCPCDSETAHKYEEPITLTGDMLIKAIATAPGYADSDMAELTFRLYDPDGIRVVDAGRMAKNNVTYTLSGVKVGKTKRLPRGLYIRNGKKFVVK